MENRQLFELLIADAEAPFSGWDFSYISKTKRTVEAPLAWSYTSVLLPHLRRAESLLDMGTGGGEFLATLRPLPARTSATEGYPPNVPVARQRLEPLGVSVYEVAEDLLLPFEDNAFDLVINRHESYSAHEVLRVLKPGGRFVTQQVGGLNEVDLNHLLGAAVNDEYAHWNLEFAAQELDAAGFRIVTRQEDFPPTRFYDVGAVVYYLKAVPWQIPGFEVDQYRAALFQMHEIMQQQGYVDIRAHRFLLEAFKP